MVNAVHNWVHIGSGIIALLASANGYYAKRIPYLACWKEITSCFKTEELAWATSLTMKENQQGTMTGTMTGRATTKEYALRVRDRMQNNKLISAVNLTQLQEVGGQSKDFSFSITFTFSTGAK